MIEQLLNHERAEAVTPFLLENTTSEERPAHDHHDTAKTSRRADRVFYEEMASTGCRDRRSGRRGARPSTRAVILSLLSSSPTAMARCISLKGSTTCPAFENASVSLDSTLIGFLYVLSRLAEGSSASADAVREPSHIRLSGLLIQGSPFLQYVSDRASFDSQLQTFVQTTYVQEQYVYLANLSVHFANADRRTSYQTLLGCQNINLANTSNLYARYTTTVICNSIVQNSINNCSLSTADSKPACADTCVSS
jgi:hypothetical protein